MRRRMVQIVGWAVAGAGWVTAGPAPREAAGSGAPVANAATDATGKEGAAPVAPRPYTFKARHLDRAEMDALLARPGELLIIDVRRPDELAAIGGFPVYLNVQSRDLEQYLAYVPRDRTIVTVSNHAVRAGRTADLLASKGFRVAGAVGAQEYEEQGGTLTKIAPPPPRQAAGTTAGPAAQ